MGFSRKFKDLTQQAKEKVAENREKIQGAVDAASVVANEKTHGKYASRIMKVNQKTGSALDRFDAGTDGGPGTDAGGSVGAQEQQHSVPEGDGPRFADEAPPTTTGESDADATTDPAGGSPATGAGPKFDDEL